MGTIRAVKGLFGKTCKSESKFTMALARLSQDRVAVMNGVNMSLRAAAYKSQYIVGNVFRKLFVLNDSVHTSQ